MKRRKFIRTSLTAAAVAALYPSMGCSVQDPKTGLILYTVRNEMNDDPEKTLDRIAELGYNWLEAANFNDGKFYGFTPAEFKKHVESRGMELISSHNGLNEKNLEEVVPSAAEAGLKYLVIPSLPHNSLESADALKKTADFFNRAGQKCKEKGMKLGFHNHTVEFVPVDGQVPYDIFLENTDPDLVTFQVDLAWMTASGNDPVDYFERYPDRFELWHVKDLTEDNRDQTLGEGIIDFKPVFAKAQKAGMKYFFVEQDSPRAHSPMESIKISRNYLISNIL